MSLKKTIDFSDFVTSMEAGELEAQATRKTFEYDSYAKQTRFVAIVLSEPIPLSSVDVQHFTKIPTPTFLDDVRKSLAGTTPADARRLSKFSFKARILGPNSPHWFLPDPCDAAYSGTDADSRAKNLKLITMHTTFKTIPADHAPLRWREPLLEQELLEAPPVPRESGRAIAATPAQRWSHGRALRPPQRT